MPQIHTRRAALAAFGLAASLVLTADVSLVAAVTGLGGAGVVISAAAGRLGAAAGRLGAAAGRLGAAAGRLGAVAGRLGAAAFGLFSPVAFVELACGAVSRWRFGVGSDFFSTPNTQSPRWPSFIEQKCPLGPAEPQILPIVREAFEL